MYKIIYMILKAPVQIEIKLINIIYLHAVVGLTNLRIPKPFVSV